MMKHLSILTGIQNPSKNLIVTNWSETPPRSTSINVRTESVYNIVRGYSLKILENQTRKGLRYIIEMKICNDLVIRYLNLSDVFIPPRGGIRQRFELGKAAEVVGIEYCTRVRSSYPIRIDSQTFYRHDPTDFLLYDYLPRIPSYTYDLIRVTTFLNAGDDAPYGDYMY